MRVFRRGTQCKAHESPDVLFCRSARVCLAVGRGPAAVLPLIGLIRLIRAGMGRSCSTAVVRVAGPGVAVPWPRTPRRCPGR